MSGAVVNYLQLFFFLSLSHLKVVLKSTVQRYWICVYNWFFPLSES